MRRKSVGLGTRNNVEFKERPCRERARDGALGEVVVREQEDPFRSRTAKHLQEIKNISMGHVDEVIRWMKVSTGETVRNNILFEMPQCPVHLDELA